MSMNNNYLPFSLVGTDFQKENLEIINNTLEKKSKTDPFCEQKVDTKVSVDMSIGAR